MQNLKARYWAWYNKYIVKGFYKSYAWIASAASLLVAYGPDLASFLLLHADLIQTGLPLLPAEYKTVLLLVAHGVVFFTRPVKQKNMAAEPPLVVRGQPWQGGPGGTP